MDRGAWWATVRGVTKSGTWLKQPSTHAGGCKGGPWLDGINVFVRRGSGEGNGTPLQYSCLENPMDGGARWAAVHSVTKSRTGLHDITFTFHFHALEKEMATHFSILAWRIPGMGDPSGLPSMGSHRVGHDWSDLAAAAAAGFQNPIVQMYPYESHISGTV